MNIRKDYDSLGIHDFRRFRHEFHAAEGNDIAFETLGHARQLQTIPNRISYFLNFCVLVVMGKDERAAILFQPPNLVVYSFNRNQMSQNSILAT